jgi:hypothetical protein
MCVENSSRSEHIKSHHERHGGLSTDQLNSGVAMIRELGNREAQQMNSLLACAQIQSTEKLEEAKLALEPAKLALEEAKLASRERLEQQRAELAREEMNLKMKEMEMKMKEMEMEIKMKELEMKKLKMKKGRRR